MSTQVIFAFVGAAMVVVAIGVLLWAFMVHRRNTASRHEAAAAAMAASDPAPQNTPLGVTGNLPVDTGYDEEEMPTVVVARPPKPATPDGRRPAPPPRTSGATIIAFDDEDDDDDD